MVKNMFYTLLCRYDLLFNKSEEMQYITIYRSFYAFPNCENKYRYCIILRN